MTRRRNGGKATALVFAKAWECPMGKGGASKRGVIWREWWWVDELHLRFIIERFQAL